MPLSDSDSDSGISDSSNEQHDYSNSAIRPPLTPEEIGVVKGLKDAFKQIDSPICCFGHVPFETRNPRISYCTISPLATVDSNAQTEG